MGQLGKLTRLPFLHTEELHKRILDQQPLEVIRRWVMSIPEFRQILAEYFGGREVTVQNLSDYAKGPKFLAWKQKREALDRVQANTKYAVSLAAEAGLDLGDAGDAIIISHVLESMEENPGVENLTALSDILAKSRSSTVKRMALKVRERELEGRARKLALDERTMEMNTVKAFVKWAQSKEAQGILSSGKPKTVQMDLLHELMFGKKPQ